MSFLRRPVVVLLAAVMAVALGAPGWAQADNEFSVRGGVNCGNPVNVDRHIVWTIWSYATLRAEVVSVEATKGVTAGPVYRTIDAGGYVHAQTYLNDDDFGPVTATVVLRWLDGGPAGQMTYSATVDVIRSKCESYPSASFESQCNGDMVVHLANDAAAGMPVMLQVISNGQWVWSDWVAPGKSIPVRVAAAGLVTVREPLDPEPLAAATWQRAGCVGPPAGSASTSPAVGGGTSIASGRGVSSGGPTISIGPDGSPPASVDAPPGGSHGPPSGARPTPAAAANAAAGPGGSGWTSTLVGLGIAMLVLLLAVGALWRRRSTAAD